MNNTQCDQKRGIWRDVESNLQAVAVKEVAARFKWDFLDNLILSIAIDYSESDGKILSSYLRAGLNLSRLVALGELFSQGEDKGQK